MKCALELITIKEVAETKYLMEEELKDAEAREWYKTICNDTINLCDTTINDKLISLATNRKQIKVSYKVVFSEDRLNNKLFRFVKATDKRYADGRISCCPMGSYYSFDTLQTYLSEHCINLECLADEYDWYGYGTYNCVLITISIPTE